jgi:hypothetical protein
VKSRLVRGITAVTAGMALILGVAALPAQADGNDNYEDITLDVLRSALTVAEDGVITPAELVDLVLSLKGALAGVKTDVVARLDAQAVATLRAKTEYAVTNVFYLENPFPFYAALYNSTVSDGAFLAQSYISGNVVTADKDVDAVGRAMMTLFTAYDVGLEKVNAPAADRGRVLTVYHQALEGLIAKMVPRCDEYGDRAGAYHIDCTYAEKTVHAKQDLSGWTIDGGPPPPGAIDRSVVGNLVMADTAKKLAQDALEELRKHGH